MDLNPSGPQLLDNMEHTTNHGWTSELFNCGWVVLFSGQLHKRDNHHLFQHSLYPVVYYVYASRQQKLHSIWNKQMWKSSPLSDFLI